MGNHLADEDFKYDVFISHSAADASVVVEIGTALRAAGLRVWNQAPMHRSTSHTDSYEIRSGLEDSRMLLLLISEHSLADEWVHFEGQTLRFRDPANKERRFVPVRLNEAPLPDTFRAVESVEWRSDQSEQTLARLVAVCTPPTPKPSARGLTVSRSVSRKRIKLDQPSRITAIAFDLAGC